MAEDRMPVDGDGTDELVVGSADLMVDADDPLVGAGDADAVPDETPATGHYAVDLAMSRLGELGGLPVGDHVAVYEDVHRRLQGALAELDEK